MILYIKLITEKLFNVINLNRYIRYIIKKIFYKIGFKLVKVQKNNFKNEIIFLHIGKCAGTQIMHISKQLSS